MRSVAALAVLGCWGEGPPRGTGARDPVGGTGRTNFSDLSGFARNQQGARAAPSGYTIDAAIQSWTQPYSASGFSETFSASGVLYGPTTVIGNPGSTAEFLTLWQSRLDPGGGLLFCKTCESHPASACPDNPLPGYFQNGLDFIIGIRNAPYQGQSYLPAVGWDATLGFDPFGIPQLQCICPKCQPGEPWSDSIQKCGDLPLEYGAGIAAIVPGFGYSASFIASAQLGPYTACTSTAYLVYAINDLNGKGTPVTATVYEGDFASPSLTDVFDQMTPTTVELTPARSVAGALWDFEAFSGVTLARPDGHPHCTELGPVWVTAHKGTAVSRVFDTLSDQTRWVDIAWRVEQATTFTDSAKSPIPPGAPIAPVQLSYAVNNVNTPLLPVTFTVTHGGEKVPGQIGMNMVFTSTNPIHDAAGLPVSGRYFQWSVTLYGRGAAGELDSDLAPVTTLPYFAGYLPIVREITVHYLVCAARARSRRIAPTSVKRWIAVDYAADISQGGTVAVDVLDDAGNVLLAGVPSGAPLGSIDPFHHPALMLRATLSSNPADCALRPVLSAWQVRWEPLVDVIEVACNSLRPALGERCAMELRVERPGPVKVEVHDAAGQLVATLVDGELPAEARMFSWDGRNRQGEIVAAGVYFVVAKVPGGHRVRRLAVVR